MYIYRGGLGRLAAWHLPGRPVVLASRWPATSNAKVGQTTYSVNRGRVETEGEKGARDKVTKKRTGKEEWNG